MNDQQPRHSVSVSGVITDNQGHALLIQRRDNHHGSPPEGSWNWPSRSKTACAARSARRPGLEVEPGALSGVYKNMNRGVVALVFRCHVTGGQLTTNDEVTAFRWADEATIRQLTGEAYAVRLLDGLRGDTSPAIRGHDGIHLL